MLKTIWLYGVLRKRCGVDKIQAHCTSVKEAVEFLSMNFYEELKPLPNRPRLLCRIKGFQTEKEIYAETDEEDIHIYPCLMGGGGGGGVFKIILGVLLIASAFLMPEILLAGIIPGLTGAMVGSLATAALGIGAGLLLGGAMELMGLVPKANNGSSGTNDSSKYLGANGNTTKIGTPIAIVMGEILQYGQLISFNVDAVDVAV